MCDYYRCEDCDNAAVLINSGGVFRTLCCPDCGCEMQYSDSNHSEEWVGHEEDDYCDYHV